MRGRQLSFIFTRASRAGWMTLLLVVFLLLFPFPSFAQEGSRPSNSFWMVDLSVENRSHLLGGERFEPGSFIDFVGVNISDLGNGRRAITLIGPQGEHINDIVNVNPYSYAPWPWNGVENNIACDEYASPGMQLIYVTLALFALPIVALPLFSAKGAGESKRYWWLIVSVLLLMNGCNMARAPFHLQASASDCREARKIVAAHAIYNGDGSTGLLPFHATEAAPIRRVLKNTEAAPLFAGALVFEVIMICLLALQIPSAIA